MSLDFYLRMPACEHFGSAVHDVFDANITHNLGAMASAASIYDVLWRPDEHGYQFAWQAIHPLETGLAWLRDNETEARKHDAPNGWGLYEHFVPFVQKVLDACREHPKACISVWR